MPKLKETTYERRERMIKIAFKKGLIEHGWTQEHLARLMKKNRESINHIINHPMRYKLRDVLALANYMGVSLVDAIGG